MSTIELTLSADKLGLFGFLKNNPTKVLRNGNFYKFLYFQPPDGDLTAFSYKGVMVKLTEGVQDRAGWELVRDLKPKPAGADLLEVLQDLELNKLAEGRTARALELNGWVFDMVAHGISTREDTAHLVRLLFVHGYSYEQAIQLFSAIVKRADLAGYFLQVANRIYKGVELG